MIPSYVTKRSLIDVDLSPARDVVHTGVCLKSSRYVFLMVNYDDRKKEYDGYTVFRDKEIDRYRLWTREEKKEIKNNNCKVYSRDLEYDKMKTFWLMCATAAFGASFVGMQVFEWSKLILEEGVRPWTNPFGAPQFGSVFFMITGFHGLHVSAGVIYLLVVANKVRKGHYDKKGYEIVEITGLYWHFVDLVWVFIFAFFYLL